MAQLFSAFAQVGKQFFICHMAVGFTPSGIPLQAGLLFRMGQLGLFLFGSLSGGPVLFLVFLEHSLLNAELVRINPALLSGNLMDWFRKSRRTDGIFPTTKALDQQAAAVDLSGMGRMAQLPGTGAQVVQQLLAGVIPVFFQKRRILFLHSGIDHDLELLLSPPIEVKIGNLFLFTHTVSLHYQAQCLYIGGISRFLSRPKISPWFCRSPGSVQHCRLLTFQQWHFGSTLGTLQ